MGSMTQIKQPASINSSASTEAVWVLPRPFLPRMAIVLVTLSTGMVKSADKAIRGACVSPRSVSRMFLVTPVDLL
ncbi:hypothetical protein WN67_05930 [Mycolicibacterium obuense]|uniref:Uncharacterized protein n=2 Tax=Mycolicibacterium obuense TaxID=1807 RepID=A0A0M2K6U3_9MYCO|nr:hypothetical protein WN67_05930 [Mycolicibacterium obuense]